MSGWKTEQNRYNLGHSECITREYEHKPCSIVRDLRGGPETADHVDIMGNYELTADVLRIVSNSEDQLVGNRIISHIKKYAAQVVLPDPLMNAEEEGKGPTLNM